MGPKDSRGPPVTVRTGPVGEVEEGLLVRPRSDFRRPEGRPGRASRRRVKGEPKQKKRTRLV